MTKQRQNNLNHKTDIEFDDSHSAIIDSPIGNLGIKTNDSYLIQLDFLTDNHALLTPTSAIAEKVVTQLNHYFNDSKYVFSLDLFLNGTTFQQKVWKALQKISVGSVKTYGEVAKNLASGARAIGNACRRNPIPIIVPCHRVVATNHIGGFAGNISGNFKEIKCWLLQHEQKK